VNIWQSYKQERGCIVHFARMANIALKDKDSARDNHHGVSLAGVSCRRRWPAPTTLALTTLLGSWRQLSGNFLITTNIYDDQTLCPILISRILIQTETQSPNIKMTKIAVENANLCGKNMQYSHFAEICRKNAATCEICGNRVFA